jgi:hypothetical protein
MTVNHPLSPRRGRPAGSGLNDESTLAKAADLLVQTPGMKPTSAFRRVVKQISSSHMRRLQVKWKADNQRAIMAARSRVQTEAKRINIASARTAATAGFSRAPLTSLAGRFASFADYPEPSFLRSFREREERMRDLIDPPHLRWLMEQEERMRNLVDPPHARRLRELEERMRNLTDPPHLRQMREYEHRMRALIDPLARWR